MLDISPLVQISRHTELWLVDTLLCFWYCHDNTHVICAFQFCRVKVPFTERIYYKGLMPSRQREKAQNSPCSGRFPSLELCLHGIGGELASAIQYGVLSGPVWPPGTPGSSWSSGWRRWSDTLTGWPGSSSSGQTRRPGLVETDSLPDCPALSCDTDTF